MNTTSNNNRENMNRVNNKLTATASESEPEALRGATLQEIERKSDRTAAPAWLKPGATFKRTTSNGHEVVAICTRLLLDGFAYITANCFGVVDHVTAFAAFDFDGVTPCDIDDDAPKFARMLRNFQRIRKEFEEYQTAHPYTEQSDTTTDAPTTLQKAGEITADPLADIISEARKQESRTMSGLNYGPIKYLRDRVLYATNGKTTAENMKEYENNLHRVTDADTYAAYLIAGFDVFVDETQVFCDLRSAFPSLTFAELCRLIRDHMGENQQGKGIAAALVPDCVILASSDEYTREKFRERHEKFYKLSSYWKGEEVNTNRESDLKKHYDRESLAVHFLLSEELYYTWGEDRAARCLDNVREIYPDMTAQELRNIRDKYAAAVSEIYG